MDIRLNLPGKLISFKAIEKKENLPQYKQTPSTDSFIFSGRLQDNIAFTGDLVGVDFKRKTKEYVIPDKNKNKSTQDNTTTEFNPFFQRIKDDLQENIDAIFSEANVEASEAGEKVNPEIEAKFLQDYRSNLLVNELVIQYLQKRSEKLPEKLTQYSDKLTDLNLLSRKDPVMVVMLAKAMADRYEDDLKEQVNKQISATRKRLDSSYENRHNNPEKWPAEFDKILKKRELTGVLAQRDMIYPKRVDEKLHRHYTIQAIEKYFDENFNADLLEQVYQIHLDRLDCGASEARRVKKETNGTYRLFTGALTDEQRDTYIAIKNAETVNDWEYETDLRFLHDNDPEMIGKFLDNIRENKLLKDINNPKADPLDIQMGLSDALKGSVYQVYKERLEQEKE